MQLSASFKYSKVANKNVMALIWRDYREIYLEDFPHKNYICSKSWNKVVELLLKYNFMEDKNHNSNMAK